NKMPATSFGLDQVNVSFLEKSNSSPLVISPRWDDSAAFITKWLQQNRSWVNDKMLECGAVYIRGFAIQNAPEFETAVNALQPKLCDEYRGTSPRSLKEGCKYAFSAADVPVNYPIAQHLEMSFLKAPPRQLYFGCMKASSKPGGETALCDFRKVYQDISPELRDKLRTKKIKYTRKHNKVGEQYTYDVGAMLDWPQLFGTSDPKEVERITKDEGAPPVQWVGEGGDCFLQEWVDEPFQYHPVTGEPVFHWTTFSMELWHSFQRMKDVNLIVHFLLVSIFSFIKYGLLRYKMALNTTFGDGTPISWKEMNEIRRAIHQNMVYSRWQKGDILCIDNFSTSHGRQPTYDRSRQVIVAWSHPLDKATGANTVKSTEAASAQPNVNVTSAKPTAVAGTVTVVSKIDETDNETSRDASSEGVPDLVESPDNSPSTTLTKDEAQELKELFLANRFQDEMATAFSKREASKGVHKRLSSCPTLADV
ncbi:MAG: hypothetical protein SGILL_010669, partial [Bacillariaceae sp.]